MNKTWTYLLSVPLRLSERRHSPSSQVSLLSTGSSFRFTRPVFYHTSHYIGHCIYFTSDLLENYAVLTLLQLQHLSISRLDAEKILLKTSISQIRALAVEDEELDSGGNISNHCTRRETQSVRRSLRSFKRKPSLLWNSPCPFINSTKM